MPETADHDQLPLEQPAAAAPRPAPVELGDLVISWHTDDPAEYGGVAADRAFFEVNFNFGGSAHVLKGALKDVAPADAPVPDKDERVLPVKRPRTEMPYGQPGPWQLVIDGRMSWHKTKREATATGLRRVAIL